MGLRPHTTLCLGLRPHTTRCYPAVLSGGAIRCAIRCAIRRCYFIPVVVTLHPLVHHLQTQPYSHQL